MIKVLVLLGFLFASLAAAQEPVAVPTPPRSQQVDSVVYITREGKKYHREECSYLKQSKIRSTLQEAHDRGLEPCKRCYRSAEHDST
jgi:hypothetical protein